MHANLVKKYTTTTFVTHNQTIVLRGRHIDIQIFYIEYEHM